MALSPGPNNAPRTEAVQGERAPASAEKSAPAVEKKTAVSVAEAKLPLTPEERKEKRAQLLREMEQLRKDGAKIEAAVKVLDVAHKGAGLVVEGAVTAGSGVGAAIGATFGGQVGAAAGAGIGKMAIRTLANGSEQLGNVAFGLKSAEEAKAEMALRTRDAAVDSAITAASALAGMGAGKLLAGKGSSLLAKSAISAAAGGTVSAGGETVQILNEKHKLNADFEKKAAGLSPAERQKLHETMEAEHRLSGQQIARRLAGAAIGGAVPAGVGTAFTGAVKEGAKRTGGILLEKAVDLGSTAAQQAIATGDVSAASIAAGMVASHAVGKGISRTAPPSKAESGIERMRSATREKAADLVHGAVGYEKTPDSLKRDIPVFRTTAPEYADSGGRGPETYWSIGSSGRSAWKQLEEPDKVVVRSTVGRLQDIAERNGAPAPTILTDQNKIAISTEALDKPHEAFKIAKPHNPAKAQYDYAVHDRTGARKLISAGPSYAGSEAPYGVAVPSVHEIRNLDIAELRKSVDNAQSAIGKAIDSSPELREKALHLRFSGRPADQLQKTIDRRENVLKDTSVKEIWVAGPDVRRDENITSTELAGRLINAGAATRTFTFSDRDQYRPGGTIIVADTHKYGSGMREHEGKVGQITLALNKDNFEKRVAGVIPGERLDAFQQLRKEMSDEIGTIYAHGDNFAKLPAAERNRLNSRLTDLTERVTLVERLYGAAVTAEGLKMMAGHKLEPEETIKFKFVDRSKQGPAAGQS